MAPEKKQSDQTIKMHRLRRAVERLRNIRRTTHLDHSQNTWFERLGKRLGLIGKEARDPSK